MKKVYLKDILDAASSHFADRNEFERGYCSSEYSSGYSVKQGYFGRATYSLKTFDPDEVEIGGYFQSLFV